MSIEHAVTFSSPDITHLDGCRWCGLSIVRGPDGFTGVARWYDGDGVTYCVGAEHMHEPQPHGYPSLDPDLADLLAEIPWRF